MPDCVIYTLIIKDFPWKASSGSGVSFLIWARNYATLNIFFIEEYCVIISLSCFWYILGLQQSQCNKEFLHYVRKITWQTSIYLCCS